MKSVVPDVLKKEWSICNYKDWSIPMKTYLIAQDLWDTIESSIQPSMQEDGEVIVKAWTKKNLMALQVIQNSCELDISNEIRDIPLAKTAWDTLKEKYGGQYIYGFNMIYWRLKFLLDRGDWDELNRHLISNNMAALNAKVNDLGQTPLHIAVTKGHVHIVERLVELISEDDLEIQDDSGMTAMSLATAMGDSQMLHCMHQKNKKNGHIPLYALACRPSAFPSGRWLVFWKKWIYASDDSGNTILHMAATVDSSTQHAPNTNAALHMQRELQWFKEIEKITPPWMRDAVNYENMKPKEIFTRDHKEMLNEGEKWMKQTATSCTVVGALIVTIMFAVVFAVPGGYNQVTGLPMFSKDKLFMLFIIFDALSLFSSTTSVLMFLGIFTSRYAEEDFLKSLPQKMIIALSSLFFSIPTMMMAFCIALLIMLPGQSRLVIPIICLASLPVDLFVCMQFPLLVDMIKSTYGPSNIFAVK
ncbi:Ankyrin repeat domain-containing protein 6 [Morella rubra]|uniref:Ankyrin repeat domain-containing protein 6 n=1 Tax=Morella rubra TaxID=262757 RepID=A0A6A1UU57_9ROSI|nr:Ankyrin repeat domain-containing protein 6 [Morella rubra]